MKIQYSSNPGSLVAAMEEESPDTNIFHGSDKRKKSLVTHILYLVRRERL